MLLAQLSFPSLRQLKCFLLREIVERSRPDGFTDNSWAGLGRENICFCTSIDIQSILDHELIVVG